MHHASAPRILVELLYGIDPAIITANNHGSIEVRISKLAKRLQMRSDRLLGNLEWLESQSLIEGLTIGRRHAQLTLCPNRAQEK